MCSDPDYEEEKLKILAGERLPVPELADLMPWGTEVYEKVATLILFISDTNSQLFLPR